MAKRDVDIVDPALPARPEAMQLAEDWREAGKVLSVRSPQVFAEMLALFEVWIAHTADAEANPIDEIYQVY